MSSATFELLILGSNGALPAYNRHPSAQVLRLHDHLFLIDCGEGTQFQLRKYGVRFSRIQHIFISHLHGDHVYGLPGLLTSYQLMGRVDPLFVYGPAELEGFITDVLSYTTNGITYPLHFYSISNFNGELIFEDKYCKVRSLPLVHRMASTGYLFEEKFPRKKLNIEKLKELNIPAVLWKSIEDGEDLQLPDGSCKTNSEFILEQGTGRRYAYCSDTRYNEQLVPFVKGVDLLYHETTFQEDLKDLAHEHYHSTAKQAATIAKKAEVGSLLAGHYSSRYEQLDQLEKECKEVFKNTIMGLEGMRIPIHALKSDFPKI